jgi:N-acetylglucosaminyldiphosphoundecaprenol N-acetyl-beta-D-mannosaminyltransferase
LGAVLNFEAGTIKRAPRWLQASGFEWLWRIKEEPKLWQRYAHDGAVLMRFVITRGLPLAILNRWYRLKCAWQSKELLINTQQRHDCVTIRLCGDANEHTIGKAIAAFQETLTKGRANVVVDLTSMRVIDGRFLGLLLMVRKYLKGQGATLRFVGVSPTIRRVFRLNEVHFLLHGAA